MNPLQNDNEAEKKSVNPLETVEGFMADNEADRKSKGMKEVMESADAVKEGVAGVMEGMEGMESAVDRGPSQRVREDKRGDLKTGGGTLQSDDDDQQQAQQIRSGLSARRALPTPEIMIKKIRTAINFQIKTEIKEALKLEKNLAAGSAQEYNVKIAKIRKLKEKLASLFGQTIEKIKEVYFGYFGTDGRRKTADEV